MQLCGFEIGLNQPLFLMAGPCVIEGEQFALDTAGRLKEITTELGIPFIYKSSYDKANRSSGQSFRGLGMEQGLQILAKVKQQIGVPVVTDVHTEAEVPEVASVVDVLQTPAFFVSANRFYPRRCPIWQTCEYQKRPVSCPRRYDTGGGKGSCSRPRSGLR